jgi:ABC-type microcin C transport system permease subunit YejE
MLSFNYKRMDLDNKISFLGGYILTAASTVSIMGVFQAALVGLVGGFFGLIGKELFYYIKKQIKEK